MSAHVHRSLWCHTLALAATLCACSEGTDAADAGFTPRRGDSAGIGDADAGPIDRPDGAPPPASSLGFVINEIRAAGDDWIELLDGLPLPVDLSGHLVADRESDGTPKLAEAVTIPDGTTLRPGERLLIVADVSPASPGFQTDCLAGAAPRCLHAEFGISQGEGDTIFLIAPDGSIVLSADYPAAAAPDGSSWARVPDGTGSFVVAAPTPGTANDP